MFGLNVHFKVHAQTRENLLFFIDIDKKFCLESRDIGAEGIFRSAPAVRKSIKQDSILTKNVSLLKYSGEECKNTSWFYQRLKYPHFNNKKSSFRLNRP